MCQTYQLTKSRIDFISGSYLDLFGQHKVIYQGEVEP